MDCPLLIISVYVVSYSYFWLQFLRYSMSEVRSILISHLGYQTVLPDTRARDTDRTSLTKQCTVLVGYLFVYENILTKTVILAFSKEKCQSVCSMTDQDSLKRQCSLFHCSVLDSTLPSCLVGRKLSKILLPQPNDARHRAVKNWVSFEWMPHAKYWICLIYLKLIPLRVILALYDWPRTMGGIWVNFWRMLGGHKAPCIANCVT